MTETMQAAADRAAKWAALAAPFRPEEIEKLPKPFSKDSAKGTCRQLDRNGYACGGYHGLPAIHLDYVGHAGVTERLNSVDPEWTWTPMFRDVNHEVIARIVDPEVMRQYIANAPMLRTDGGLWITLTVLGVTRPGFGDASGKTGPNATKELIGDALRNAAMRFGVATYLWSKSEAAAAKLAREEGIDLDDEGPAPRQAERSQDAPQGPPASRGRQAQADPVASTRSQIGRWAHENGMTPEAIEGRYVRWSGGTPIHAETNAVQLTKFLGVMQALSKHGETVSKWMHHAKIKPAELDKRYLAEYGYTVAEELDPALLDAFIKDWQGEYLKAQGDA